MYQISKASFLVFLLLSLALQSFSQLDAYFSQYMFNGIYINPAFAGYQPQLQAALYHKRYGDGGMKTPSTSFFSLSSPLRYNQLGAGLQIVSDFDGVVTRNLVSGSLAYKIHFETGILAFGVNLGIQQVNFDPNTLLIKDESDAQISKDRINNSSPDFGSGLFYQDKKIYAGVSIMHLFGNKFNFNEGNNFVYSRPLHLNFIAGCKIFETGNWSGTGSSIIRYVNANTFMIDATFHLKYADLFWIGASVKNPWMVGAQTGFKISEWLKPQAGTNIKIGYAFDLALGQLKYRASTMHEIFVLVDFAPLISSKKIRNQKVKVTPLFF